MVFHDLGLIKERPLNVMHSVSKSKESIEHLLYDSLGSDNAYEKEMKLVSTRRFDIVPLTP